MGEMRTSRKQEILAIAARVFRDKGYHATSMDDLANECGLHKGSLYHYFENKEHILQEVIQSYFEVALQGLEQIYRSKATPMKKLRRSVDAQMRAIESHLDAVSVALREDRAVANPYREIYIAQRDRFEGYMAGILEEGIEKGVFRRVDIKLTAKALLGMCNWATVWYRRDGRSSSSEIAKHFADLMLFGLETKRAGRKSLPREMAKGS
jgi:AcrR family transcriptional regulator